MTDTPKVPDIQAQESMWIEIIRHMESFYGQLADAQSEAERRAEELSQAKELDEKLVAVKTASDNTTPSGLLYAVCCGRCRSQSTPSRRQSAACKLPEERC